MVLEVRIVAIFGGEQSIEAFGVLVILPFDLGFVI